MKPKLIRVAPPATDAELADAERRQTARDTAHMERIEDEREQRTLAKAGDPEAVAALQATASMIESRPVEHNDGEEPAEPIRKSRGDTRRNAKERRGNATPHTQNSRSAKEGEQDRELPTDASAAYQLMDLAFRKWKKTSQRDLRGANRELARDLGGDAAIYLQSGVVRLSDMLDAMNKLTALAKPKEEEPEGGDIESEMESMREALRGGR